MQWENAADKKSNEEIMALKSFRMFAIYSLKKYVNLPHLVPVTSKVFFLD